MTIMAGLFSRSDTEKPPLRICTEIKKMLSRHAADTAVEFSDDRVWMAKVDIGAYASPGIYTDDEGGYSLLTGEPLLDDGPGDRYSDLKRLHSGWIKGDLSSTARTRGAFCAACYSPAKQQLRLVTDRLGLRGLYLMVSDRFVLFATAFRIIEALDCIGKTLDIAAVAERCTFGAPLYDRTDFFEVKRLVAAETVVIDSRGVQRSCYWSWDSIRPSTSDGVVECLYESFAKAVSLRLKGDRTALAFLSGGLDSRSIVAALLRRGVSVHTLNISGPRSQDRALGRQFAEASGTHHVEFDPGRSSRKAWWEQVSEGVHTWRCTATVMSAPPERPALIWNGEGGSVPFGHVHLTQAIVDLARSGDFDQLLEDFSAHNYWSTVWQRFLRRRWSEELRARVAQRFRDEVCRAAPADPGRLPYFFLLFNDQARKLDALQENADLIRAEMLTPFYDIEFLCVITAANIDHFIGHKLYVEWLRLFQAQVYSIPWQSYPGHVPSPAAVPAGLEYQWGRRTGSTPDDRRFARRMLRLTLRPSKVPDWLIRRAVVAGAAIWTLLSLANYGYLLKSAEIFATAWANSRSRRTRVDLDESKSSDGTRVPIRSNHPPR